MAADTDFEPPPLAERRPSLRRRALLGCMVVHSGGRYSFPCTIRNLSTDGARLSYGPNEVLPEDFWMIIRREQMGHKARRVWARRGEAGVRFEASFPMDAVPSELSFLKRFGHGTQ
jgi:hypothetical protein